MQTSLAAHEQQLLQEYAKLTSYERQRLATTLKGFDLDILKKRYWYEFEQPNGARN